MGRVTTTSTVYVCDRCGSSHESAYHYAEAMSMRIDHSGRGYDGGIGGITLHKWLCGRCVRDFKKFMENA